MVGLTDLERLSSWWIFFYFCLLVVALTATSNWILISDDLFYGHFSEQLTGERISTLIEESRSWSWVIYVLIPVLYFLKFNLVSLCLYGGILFSDSHVMWRQIFKIVTISEFVFLVPPIIKLYWFVMQESAFSLEDLQNFYPFSVYSIFEAGTLDAWLAYPLQVFSIFELSYCCILALQLKSLLGKSFLGSLGFVCSTYGIGILVWLIFVMFLTVSYT